MRLLTNIGAERIANLLPPRATLKVAGTTVSIPGMAKLLGAHSLERLLLSPETVLGTDDEDRRRRNSLTLRGDGIACLGWLDGADVRVTDLPLRQSLLLCGPAPVKQAFLGDCDLTTAGLGLAPSRAAGMIQLLEDPAEIAGVTTWFDDLWRRSSSPSPDPLTAALVEATANFGAADVYRRALSSLFADMVASEDALPDPKLGLEETASGRSSIASTGHAVMAQNVEDGGNRRYILVQLPEKLDPDKSEQKTAADYCDKLDKPRNIAELTKERLRRAGSKVKADNPSVELDTGFRVYKLATSNLKPWQPGDDFAADLLDATGNILPGRSEDDLLVELLLKTGIDLALPSQTRTIAGRAVHVFGGGTLVVCLADIPASEARALGDGIADWLAEIGPPGKTTLYFKDSGFDPGGNRAAEARANLAATLRQRLGDEAIEKLGAI